MTTTTPPTDTWLRPSGRLTVLRATEVALLSLAVIAVAAIVVATVADSYWVILTGAVGLSLGVICEVLVLRRVRSWGYCERPEELLVRRGLLVKRLSVVPYGRMQFVDVTAGLAERIFKLATVQLHTAAAATDARIPGLTQAEAQRLRDQLTSLGESRLSGL